MKYCVYRRLINGGYYLCGRDAHYLLNGSSLCAKHALATHESGMPASIINEVVERKNG